MTTMTPHQVFTVAALGSAAGVLALLLLAALSYGIGIATIHAFDHLCEKRQQWQDRRAGRAARREFDRITALYDQPAHDPQDPR